MSEENVKPCSHMVGLINRAADGNLRGLAKWYAWAHIHRCSGCTAFLRRLEATVLALRVAREANSDDGAMDRLRAQVRTLASAEKTETGKPRSET